MSTQVLGIKQHQQGSEVGKGGQSASMCVSLLLLLLLLFFLSRTTFPKPVADFPSHLSAQNGILGE